MKQKRELKLAMMGDTGLVGQLSCFSILASIVAMVGDAGLFGQLMSDANVRTNSTMVLLRASEYGELARGQASQECF